LQPGKVSEVMQAFETFLGTNDMMAYLAMSAGFYEHKINKLKYPCIQLRTVKELMKGKDIERQVNMALDETFKKAPGSKKKDAEQTEFGV
jgi:hypothetical protein